jgi:glutaredoxin-related protein
MQCEEIYLIEKMKARFTKEFEEIQQGFQASEIGFRARQNEELFLLLKECSPNYEAVKEKYRNVVDVIAWGENRLNIRDKLEKLKEKVRSLP